MDIQLILEFKNSFENIIQSFLKIRKGRFFGTPVCVYIFSLNVTRPANSIILVAFQTWVKHNKTLITQRGFEVTRFLSWWNIKKYNPIKKGIKTNTLKKKKCFKNGHSKNITKSAGKDITFYDVLRHFIQYTCTVKTAFKKN